MAEEREHELSEDCWCEPDVVRFDANGNYEDETMIDLGGGMVVPLSELLEEDE